MVTSFLVKSYTLDVVAKTLTLPSITTVDIASVVSIKNLTTNYDLHKDHSVWGIVSAAGSVFTLTDEAMTKCQANTDLIEIVYAVSSDHPLPTSGGGGGGGGGGDASAANQVLQTTELAAIKTAVQLLDDVVGTTGAAVPSKAIVLGIQDNEGEMAIAPATENGALGVGNAIKKFRDGFADLAQGAAPDSAIWDVSWTSQGSSSVGRAGDAQGSSYMKISMCPITPGSEFVMTTKRSFKFPMRFINMLSISQRIVGQEFEVSIVGVDGAGAITTLTPKSDLSILGTVSITSNVATINFASAHGLKTSDRVILVGNTERRLNVGPVSVTVVTATQITVPCTLTNGTYTAGGVVRWADPLAYAKNGAGLLHENATATNATFLTRRNGFNTRLLNSTIVTTANAANVALADPFNATSMNQVIANQEEFTVVPRAPDSVAAPGTALKWHQGLPDEELEYKIRIRAKNLDNITRPVARITAIAKTGTTTATVTTDVAHGLATTDFVQIYGVRDIVNFPNLTASTQVASIIDANNFTIVIGSAVTASSSGGTVFINQGSVLAPGISAINVQSISRTNNILALVGNTTWTGFLPGETVHLYGCDATSMGLYDGFYKVLRINTTTLELESVGTDFVSINCGGAIMRRSDFRVHAISEIEHTRHIVELSNAHGSTDISKSVSVAVANTPAVTMTSTTVAGTAAVDAAVPNPVAIGGRAANANIAAMSAAGDLVAQMMTMIGAAVQKPYCLPEAEWNASLALTTTSDVAIQTAAGAGIKRHLTMIHAINTGGATVSLLLRDGTTTRMTIPLPVNIPVTIEFPTGLLVTANTALNAQLSAAGTVQLNATGYTAP